MGSRLSLLLAASLLVIGCGHTDPRRFALRAPVTRDQDLDDVRVPCKKKKDKEGKEKCEPAIYESSFAWDAADNTIFRPVVQFFAADPGGEAVNVNAFDEAPDSSWFVNRIGAKPMTPEEAAAGFCPYGPELSDGDAPGSWVIDHGKDNGANPGFRVLADGTKFMFKTDDTQPERATAASAIASRIYYAFGFWAPCDAVVWFPRDRLKLKPGLKVKANVGPERPFDQNALDGLLEKTAHRGDLFRAAASRWLPGLPMGPFTYAGVREDDPSDTIPHEDRRDLRGGRVLAAWLNHFDSREQNSMMTWLPAEPKDPDSKGHVRRWYIDLGDCFGSEWEIDGLSRRHGHSYVLDFPYLLEDFLSLGIPDRPWEHAKRTPGAEIFGYWGWRDFDPDVWRSEYPNPTFARMTERDAAWATRILARFTKEHIEAFGRVGDFTNPNHTRHLVDLLLKRRAILLRRYFAKLSPVTDVAAKGDTICGLDLARSTETWPGDRFVYKATVTRAGGEAVGVETTTTPDGRVCVKLDANRPNDKEADDAVARYVVLGIRNGVAPGPLAVHAYDLGPKRGYRVVGLERPEQ